MQASAAAWAGCRARMGANCAMRGALHAPHVQAEFSAACVLARALHLAATIRGAAHAAAAAAPDCPGAAAAAADRRVLGCARDPSVGVGGTTMPTAARAAPRGRAHVERSAARRAVKRCRASAALSRSPQVTLKLHRSDYFKRMRRLLRSRHAAGRGGSEWPRLRPTRSGRRKRCCDQCDTPHKPLSHNLGRCNDRIGSLAIVPGWG